jgi:tetratricopeptide (TPR) repeat protein
MRFTKIIGLAVLVLVFLRIGLCLAGSLEQGIELAGQGKFIDAKRAFAETLKIDQFDMNAKIYLEIVNEVIEHKIIESNGVIFFKALGSAFKGKNDIAMDEINQLIKLDQKNVAAYNFRAELYKAKRDFAKSLADFNKALAINPKYIPAYFNRGRLYQDKDEIDKAIADYSRALDIDNTLLDVYYSRGDSFLAKKKFDKAMADFNKALEINPKFAPAYRGRGDLYSIKGNFPKAIEAYNRVLTIDKSDYSSYFSKAVACEKVGRKQEAIAAYTGFIQSAPPNDKKMIKFANNRIVNLKKQLEQPR